MVLPSLPARSRVQVCATGTILPSQEQFHSHQLHLSRELFRLPGGSLCDKRAVLSCRRCA